MEAFYWIGAYPAFVQPRLLPSTQSFHLVGEILFLIVAGDPCIEYNKTIALLAKQSLDLAHSNPSFVANAHRRDFPLFDPASYREWMQA